MTTERLGVGFVGSGFNARFHIQSLTSVREIDVRGVWSPNEKNAASTAALARELDVGEARPYKTIRDMVADPAINALWQHRRDRRRDKERRRDSARPRLRKTACPQRRRSEEGPRSGEERWPQHRVPREPAFFTRHRARTRAGLGPRRIADGSSLSRPRRRGAQRATHD